MTIRRLFFCAQLSQLAVSMKDDKVTLSYTTSGGRCRTPMVTVPLLGFVIGLILYLFYFAQDEKEPAKTE